MRFLFVIPNYSRQLSDIKMLNRCVKSILKYESNSEQDIWIFDDGSPFFDRDLIEHKRVIRRENNQGYAVTINEALKFAKNYHYSHVVTVNTDVELVGPMLNRCEKIMSFDCRIAVIGGLLLYPNGRIQAAGFSVTPEGAPIEYFKNLMFEHHVSDVSTPKYVLGVTGALQCIRLSALEKIGVYDTGFHLSYEDVEFCFRTWKNKFKCFYDPHIKAIHAESVTRGYHVGEKELASLNRWLKSFNKSWMKKVLERVEDANLEGQRKAALSNYSYKLRQVISPSHSNTSYESEQSADQHPESESCPQTDETHTP